MTRCSHTIHHSCLHSQLGQFLTKVMTKSVRVGVGSAYRKAIYLELLTERVLLTFHSNYMVYYKDCGSLPLQDYSYHKIIPSLSR